STADGRQQRIDRENVLVDQVGLELRDPQRFSLSILARGADVLRSVDRAQRQQWRGRDQRQEHQAGADTVQPRVSKMPPPRQANGSATRNVPIPAPNEMHGNASAGAYGRILGTDAARRNSVVRAGSPAQRRPPSPGRTAARRG